MLITFESHDRASDRCHDLRTALLVALISFFICNHSINHKIIYNIAWFWWLITNYLIRVALCAHLLFVLCARDGCGLLALVTFLELRLEGRISTNQSSIHFNTVKCCLFVSFNSLMNQIEVEIPFEIYLNEIEKFSHYSWLPVRCLPTRY